ncbi:MAG TPA: BMP family ABC transporter substrate-binding protein [Thermomicrobiales bacterium]|nr:BMP family ABC transporter substrate-binding protein [Thermomicrobiales bacterium]
MKIGTSTQRLNRRIVIKGAAVAPALGLLGAGTRSIRAQSDILVTMVTDTAGLGDQNFNDLGYRGLLEAKEDFGITEQVIESQDAASYIPNLTTAAEQGELTIAVGFLLTDALTEVAAQYPDDNFLIIDAVSEGDNILSVVFKEHEGAFLGGVVAGLTTDTNRIGVVGGQKIPPVVRYVVGFEAGVRSANPEATVEVAYADTFGDPALGKEFTLAQYNAGADIVFPVAGATGIGSFDAAREKGPGFWVIAADTDQQQLGAEHQLCVVTKGVDVAVYTGVEQVVKETFEGGVQDLGLAEGGVGLTDPVGNAEEEYMAVAARYGELIIAGDLVVPSTEEELEDFEPVPAPEATPIATPGA